MSLAARPTITAFERSPDGGRGLARDMRVRWALEEVVQPHDVRPMSFAAMKEPAHRALHPFGQIPTFEDGEVSLFESGAIVLHIATCHAGLLPADANARARAINWMFAAVSTVEPAIVDREVVMYLERDEPWFAKRLRAVKDRIRGKLNDLTLRLGDAHWLDGDFSAGDLMMVDVLRRLGGAALLQEYPSLLAYVDRARHGRPSAVLSKRNAPSSTLTRPRQKSLSNRRSVQGDPARTALHCEDRQTSEHVMITVTAFKWVPPFAAGQVRDHRVRWMLNEIGWDYDVHLIDPAVQSSSAYLAEQPFGQVPVLRESGRPALFESGAIVLDLAERSGKLWPADRDAQAQVRCWVVAALNSVEPYLSNVAEVDFFTDDETLRNLRRPGALAAATQRLGKLSAALGDRIYLVGREFTAADLMLSSVLRVAEHAELLAPYPNLSAYRERCLERPAFRKAVADQRRDIDAHGPEDMGWNPAMFAETAAN